MPSPPWSTIDRDMQKRKATLQAALALAALTATLIAGCGGSSGNGVESKSASEILAASKKATDKAQTVHVSGSISTAGTPLTLNLEVVEGKGAKGKVSEGGVSAEVITIDGSAYIKGDAALYKRYGGSQAAKLLEGKWLKAPANSAELASLSSLTNLKALFDAIFASHGKLVKGSTTTISGQKAIAVKDSSTGGVLYVATTGEPYPVEIAKSANSSQKIDFSEWNQPVSLKAPSNTIDISKLKQGG